MIQQNLSPPPDIIMPVDSPPVAQGSWFVGGADFADAKNQLEVLSKGQPKTADHASNQSLPTTSKSSRHHSAHGSGNKQYLSPAEAIKAFRHQLTKHERDEILDYPEVYYVGQKAETKVEVAVGGTGSPNLAKYFDDDAGVYKAQPGDHIAYRYELLSSIGKGSFACVVQAFDHKEDRMCALKIVKNVDASYQRLLAREIAVLAHLKRLASETDPNVVLLYDNFWFRKHQVMVFESLSINLFDLNRKNDFQGFENNICRKFAKSILIALDTLYHNEIIHADLKPENILLKRKTRTGLKIIDFGWSHFTWQKPFATYIQSRFYRAPEIILGKVVNLRLIGSGLSLN